MIPEGGKPDGWVREGEERRAQIGQRAEGARVCMEFVWRAVSVGEAYGLRARKHQREGFRCEEVEGQSPT